MAPPLTACVCVTVVLVRVSSELAIHDIAAEGQKQCGGSETMSTPQFFPYSMRRRFVWRLPSLRVCVTVVLVIVVRVCSELAGVDSLHAPSGHRRRQPQRVGTRSVL